MNGNTVHNGYYNKANYYFMNCATATQIITYKKRKKKV